jgi:two-component system cell cycle sensor histidine kinase/response regulator CckA
MDLTEQLRDENARLREALARLEARLRAREAGGLDLDAVFPAFPALLFLFSADDRYLDYRAGEGLFAPPEAFLGRRIDEVLPPPLGPTFRAAMARAREAGVVQLVEYALPLPGGERHFEARLLALPDRRVVILATDVTERRAAQETVRRQEAQLLGLLALSPVVVYSLRGGPGGLEVSGVSGNVERVLGHRLEEVRRPGWWAAAVHPDDREGALASAARVLAEGRVAHHYRFRHADGRWRWIRDELLRTSGDGQPLEVVGAFLDVTAEQELEARLGESQERFRELIEGSPDLLAVFDAAGRVAYASPSSIRLLGYQPDQLLGRPAMDLVAPEDAPRTRAFLGELAASPGATRRIELRLSRAGGGSVVFDSLVRNLLHLPAVGGLVANARDVTEQRRLEAQVQQAQKLESVGRLAGGVAHDFNNLLIGILGYAELLEEGMRAGRPSLEDLGEIRKAGERARDLTAQLLAVASRQVSEPRVVELNAVLQDSEKLLRRVLGEDIDLSVQLEPRPWKVKVDPTSLQQVVLNLVVNARDAMPRGGRLTIETANVELDERYALGHRGVPPGPYVLLAISDSGHGMTPEVQAHAFEPFFTTKAPGTGTGLGLATVWGIVKQAGGHVWLYSEPGRGTTFKIYLPRTDEAAVGRPPRPPAATLRGSETILVVEDEASVRELAARALAEAGYRVLAAGGGQEALELAAGHDAPIDLLLTDVVMPGLSGKQVADALSAARPGLRVLYASGYTQNTIVHHGVLDPGVRFLAKPFTPSVLLERVRAVLDEP